MRVLAISFALSHELEVTCDAPWAATAPFRTDPVPAPNFNCSAATNGVLPARVGFGRLAFDLLRLLVESAIA
jgi:hypothetical protein